MSFTRIRQWVHLRNNMSSRYLLNKYCNAYHGEVEGQWTCATRMLAVTHKRTQLVKFSTPSAKALRSNNRKQPRPHLWNLDSRCDAVAKELAEDSGCPRRPSTHNLSATMADPTKEETAKVFGVLKSQKANKVSPVLRDRSRIGHLTEICEFCARHALIARLEIQLGRV